MLSSEEIFELESHLRNAVDELRVSVLSTEEAFLIATRRVGPPQDLAMEFGKINQPRSWMRRAQWMLGGYLLFSVLFGVVGNIGNFATLLAVRCSNASGTANRDGRFKRRRLVVPCGPIDLGLVYHQG